MNDHPPRTSPLHAVHEAAGAAFTDFGGWLMPVRYSSDLAEHHAVRTAAGLFDISHMAELVVRGPAAAAALDAALTANVSAIPVPRARYALLLAEDGGVIDDLIVYALAPEEFLVVANAGNREPVVAALSERLSGFDAELDDRTDAVALLAVQGPRALEVLAATVGLEATDGELAPLPYYASTRMRFTPPTAAPVPVRAARTGYTGEDGFELFLPAEHAAELWAALTEAGAPLGLVPCGLAARDTLRLEAGMPLYGHELGRGVLPAQAGLARVAPPKGKDADFVGRAAASAPLAPEARVLVGLVAEGRRAGRAGYAVHAAGGTTPVGEVTSGALSPTLGHPVAMAFVDPASSEPGTQLELDVRGTRVPATVVTLPFYQRANRP